MCVCLCVCVQIDGVRGEKGQKGEPAVIEPVSRSLFEQHSWAADVGCIWAYVYIYIYICVIHI